MPSADRIRFLPDHDAPATPIGRMTYEECMMECARLDAAIDQILFYLEQDKEWHVPLDNVHLIDLKDQMVYLKDRQHETWDRTIQVDPRMLSTLRDYAMQKYQEVYPPEAEPEPPTLQAPPSSPEPGN